MSMSEMSRKGGRPKAFTLQDLAAGGSKAKEELQLPAALAARSR